jgi:hypothetical protein
MERLMMLQVQAQGCVAEAWLNGVAVARATPAQPVVDLPVHEYALAGANRLELLINPEAQEPLLLAAAELAASARLLLPRLGAPADAGSARSLAECSWGLAAGQSAEAPLLAHVEVDLPLAFPRWRWLDAPPAQGSKALEQQALAFVQGLALDLSRGQVESFMTATRLRNEELALAYQRDPASEQARLRKALLQGYAAQALSWPPPKAESFRLRPLAGGRLLECLGPEQAPALQSAPDAQGRRWALPLRLAWVENRFYVLR